MIAIAAATVVAPSERTVPATPTAIAGKQAIAGEQFCEQLAIAEYSEPTDGAESTESTDSTDSTGAVIPGGPAANAALLLAFVAVPPRQPSVSPPLPAVRADPPITAGLAAMPITPLEQAVHDLISQLEAPNTDDDEPVLDEPASPAPALDAPIASRQAIADQPRHVAAVPLAREIAAPQELANPSHVHLVLEDGPDRVVVTVAVRGNEVNVALRGGDEAITAALARNAASLDHAMRTRGLDLTSFTAERERDREQPDNRSRDPERDAPGQPFTLEEPA